MKTRQPANRLCLPLLLILVLTALKMHAQGVWTNKPPVGYITACERIDPYAFVANGQAYMGGGTTYGWKNAYSSLNDQFRYDPVNDIWQGSTVFPGAARHGAVAFALNNKGYITAGINASATTGSMTPGTVSVYLKDTWEYNPVTQSWSQKADFGSSGRYRASAFVIDSLAYVGLGSSDNSPGYRYDLWKYNSTTNTWQQLNSLPNSNLGRYSAGAFSVNGKGYISCGFTSAGPVSDTWEYNPVTDSWLQKASMPGAVRGACASFQSNTYGYIAGGENAGPMNYYNDCWQFDPSANTWLQRSNMPFTVSHPASFSLNNQGYVSCGYAAGGMSDILLSYNPATNTWTTKHKTGSHGRIRSRLVAFDNKLFLTGGTQGDRSYNTVTAAFFRRDSWWFNPADTTWTQGDSLPVPLTSSGSFVIDSCIYIVGGLNPSQVAVNDNWQYNPYTQAWTQKASFPHATARTGAISMTISNRGYYGMGASSTVSAAAFPDDWWEYDKATNTWIQRASHTFLQGRLNAMTFTINGKGYLVGGISTTATNCETWEYNPVTDTWLRRADLSTLSRNGGAAFSIYGKGYVSCGWKQLVNSASPASHYNDLWEFDPVNNVWAAKGSPPIAYGREGVAGASLNNRGYIFGGMELAANTGSNNIQYYYKSDLYEYVPDNITCLITDTVLCTGDTVAAVFATENLTLNPGNVYSLQLSNAGGSFATPVVIGTLNSTATSGTVTGVIPAAQTPGTGYRLRIASSDFNDIGSENGINILISKSPVTINTLTPSTGFPNDSITLGGNNFIGATHVKFNGINAGFRLISNTQIKAAVPPLATTGKVSVTTSCGTYLSSPTFTVPSFSFTVNAFIQSLYINDSTMKPVLYEAGLSSDTSAVDTLQIRLHEPGGQFTEMIMRKTVLKKNGTAVFSIPGGYRYSNWYISIQSRNSLQTWSKFPVMMSGLIPYDFRY